MSNCTTLSSHNRSPPVITKTNLFELIPDSYDVRPGTQVTISCASSLKIVGDHRLTCLVNGQWNYTTKPYCKELETDSDRAWYDSTRNLIIICVIWGLAIVFVLALLIKIIAIVIRNRRHDEHGKGHTYHDGGRYIHHGQGHEHGSEDPSHHTMGHGEQKEKHHHHGHHTHGHKDNKEDHEPSIHSDHFMEAHRHHTDAARPSKGHGHHREHEQLNKDKRHHHKEGHTHHSGHEKDHTRDHNGRKHDHYSDKHEQLNNMHVINDDESVPGYEFSLKDLNAYRF